MQFYDKNGPNANSVNDIQKPAPRGTSAQSFLQRLSQEQDAIRNANPSNFLYWN